MSETRIESQASDIPVSEFDRMLSEIDLLGAVSVEMLSAEAARPVTAIRVQRWPTNPVSEHLYGYVVANDLDVPMTAVRVDHVLPPNTRCVGVRPPARIEGDQLIWHLVDIPPGARAQLKVKVIPDKPGQPFSADQAVFRVSHTTASVVRRPSLTLNIDGPDSVSLGETAEWNVTVRNDGTAPTTGVEVIVHRGAGLAGPAGDIDSSVALGTLEVGGAATVVVTAVAGAAGVTELCAAVMSTEMPPVDTKHRVAVVVARLSAEWVGPRDWVLGESAEITLVLKNDGTADATEVTAGWGIPAGLEVVECSPGVECPPPGDLLAVSLAGLAAGEERHYPVRLRPTTPGDWEGTAEVAWAGSAAVRTTYPAFIDFPPDAPAGPLAGLAAEIDAGLALIAPEAPLPVAPVENGVRSVVFSVGPTRYALPLDSVLEIGPPLPTTAVPYLPPWIAGVANCRGDVVSIVHLGRFAGFDDQMAPARRLLLVRDPHVSDAIAGFLVDSVAGIQALPRDLTPTTVVRAVDPLSNVAAGVAVTPAGLTVVLNPGDLLAATAPNH
jgi:chemotaxis signal transduction protein